MHWIKNIFPSWQYWWRIFNVSSQISNFFKANQENLCPANRKKCFPVHLKSHFFTALIKEIIKKILIKKVQNVLKMSEKIHFHLMIDLIVCLCVKSNWKNVDQTSWSILNLFFATFYFSPDKHTSVLRFNSLFFVNDTFQTLGYITSCILTSESK